MRSFLNIIEDPCTERKISKYGVISGPNFPAFGLNTEIYSLNLRIRSDYRKIRTRNNSVFGHFSRSENTSQGKLICPHIYLQRAFGTGLLSLEKLRSTYFPVCQCRSENLLTFSSLHKSNVPKVSRYNTFYFLRYARLRYVQFLFTNTQK